MGEYISLQEAAERLDSKLYDVYKLARDGIIYSHRTPNGQILLRADEVSDGHIKSKTQATTLEEPDGSSVIIPSPAPFARNIKNYPEIREYQPLQQIGKGGYGTVYKAHHTKLDQVRAMKELQQPSELSVKAFENEARLLAKCEQAGLPKVFEYFEHEGRYYIVMDFIDGPNLRQWVKRNGWVSEPQAIDWAIDILATLDYLHTQSIIHADVKPANIIISSKTDRPVLVDLGIAKTKDHAIPARSTYFAAPEQYDGQEIDQRTDLYSLGATLYFILSGHTPTDARDRKKGSRLLALSSQAPSLTRHLEQVINTALALNKADRWQSAHEMMAALQGDILPLEESTADTAP